MFYSSLMVSKNLPPNDFTTEMRTTGVEVMAPPVGVMCLIFNSGGHPQKERPDEQNSALIKAQHNEVTLSSRDSC